MRVHYVIRNYIRNVGRGDSIEREELGDERLEKISALDAALNAEKAQNKRLEQTIRRLQQEATRTLLDRETGYFGNFPNFANPNPR